MIDKRKIAKMFAVAFILCPSLNKILDITVILQDVYTANNVNQVSDIDNIKKVMDVDIEEVTIKEDVHSKEWFEDPFFEEIDDSKANNDANIDRDYKVNDDIDVGNDTNRESLETITENEDNTEDNNEVVLKETTISKIKSFTVEDLMDYDYLYNNFYTVDHTTTLSSELLNGKKLLEKDLTIEKNAEVPQILILHTHSQEFFANSDTNNIDTGIVGVGDYLTELLTKKGYNVIHDRSVYDYVNGVLDRNNAYTLASLGAEEIIEANPSIEIVIDLHRDGIADESKHITSMVDGKEVAPIMLFNGISYTNKLGNIDYLYNPYIEDNLATSLQMKLKAEEYYPDVFRKIYIKGYRYVLHLKPRSMLIEAGFQTNTKEEVCNSMELLANILDMVFAK